MSLTVDGVWKAGVWAPTVWADGVWREGEAPPVEPAAGSGARSMPHGRVPARGREQRSAWLPDVPRLPPEMFESKPAKPLKLPEGWDRRTEDVDEEDLLLLAAVLAREGLL